MSTAADFAEHVISETMAPHFREYDYAGGLNAAADELFAKASGKPLAATESAADAQQQQGTRRDVQGARGSSISPMTIIILAVIFFFVIMPMLSRRRSRSGCIGCLPLFFPFGGSGITFGGGGGGGGWGGGGGGGMGGAFGGGGSFGGGGASGGW